MPLIKSTLSLSDFVTAPSVQHQLGPVCMTCGRLVDREELVEGYPGETTHAKVLVKHHGAEELGTFEFGSTNWDYRDLGSMMRRRNWFDPTRHEGLGLGQRVESPGDHSDEDPAKIIVGGS